MTRAMLQAYKKHGIPGACERLRKTKGQFFPFLDHANDGVWLKDDERISLKDYDRLAAWWQARLMPQQLPEDLPHHSDEQGPEVPAIRSRR